MTTPDVPLRLELTFELDATPAQVWDAIATGRGITSWFLPTDVEERVGGTIVTHMGETSSPGEVTAFEPPHRFAYEEPEWAGLAEHAGAEVTPLATEFLIEAASGGTTVLRVVSSAFGTGADWEREFFEEMEKGWTPYFDRLRLYLRDFPGQHATPMWLEAKVDGKPAEVFAAMCARLGITAVGQRVEAHGLTGTVERLIDEDTLVRIEDPVGGYLALAAFVANGTTLAVAQAQLFSAAAAASYIEREQANWQAWLESIEVGP